MADSNRRQGKSHVDENQEYTYLSIEENGQLFLKTCFGMLMPSSV